MGRSSIMFVLYVVILASFLTSIYGRKLNTLQENRSKLIDKNQVEAPPGSDNMYRASLPKGTVPNSAPSKKGHSFVVDEKLIARHLAALDRILRSVPSPGVGH